MTATLQTVTLGRKTILLLKSMASLSLAFVLSGCPANTPPAGTLTGKVTIKGSNTFGEELARRLIEEYRKDQPGVSFDLESKGTASGFAALLAGECDIAAASRLPNEGETKQARARGLELNGNIVGYYGVAVIVNTNNPIGDLSRDQVRDIFTGIIQNWKAVGGLDIPIHVYIRDPVAGTHLGFRELAMENRAYAATAQTFTNYAGLAAAVVQDVGGIGYSSMGLAKRAGVKLVSIERLNPTFLTVNESLYPYSRSIRLYTNKAKETPAAKDFIRFVQSKRGQEIVSQTGFVGWLEPRLDSYSTD